MRFESVEQAKGIIQDHIEVLSMVGRILDYYGVDPDSIHLIPGKRLHAYMVSDDAIYSETEECLVFLGNSNEQKFLYYMGAENEAELVAKFGEVSIYQGIDYERIERYLGE